MNQADRLELRSFESDLRQLLKKHQELKSELASLRTLLSRRDEEIERLQSALRMSERAYSNLKIARMIEVSDSDLKEGKLRITRLVREVNKCIRLLSAEMGDIDENSDSKEDSDSNATEKEVKNYGYKSSNKRRYWQLCISA